VQQPPALAFPEKVCRPYLSDRTAARGWELIERGQGEVREAWTGLAGARGTRADGCVAHLALDQPNLT